MIADRELLRDFVNEIGNPLTDAEYTLVNLQTRIDGESILLTDPLHAATNEEINRLFRMFHSCKGSAAFLDLTLIVEVAHKIENLLSLLRSGKMALDGEKIDIILEGTDLLKLLLATVENDEPMEKYAEGWKELSLRLALITESTADLQTVKPEEYSIERLRSEVIYENQPEEDIDDLKLDVTPDMIKVFADEALEKFDALEHIAIENEKCPSRENIEEFRRTIHSFKGNCGFMGFGDLEKLAHETETLMETVAERPTPNLAKRDWDVVLMVIDIMRFGVYNAVEFGVTNLPKGEVEGLLTVLGGFMMNNYVASGRLGDILVARGEATPEGVDAALALQNRPFGTIMVEMGLASPDAVEEALKIQGAIKKSAEGKPAVADQSQAIRVNLEKLDNLINLTGELVIATSMATHDPESANFNIKEFRRSTLQLKRITNELQDVALTMRMVPVSDVFKKLTRVVYNTAKTAAKKIDFTYSGEDTEVDKTIIEVLSDPLTHMIRNSIDHGIEPPDERFEKGKPVSGSVHISARHEGGEVVIEITDDGRGLDRDKILRKSIEKGLITGDGENMSDSAVYQMIFAPGFSTAEKVTELSGRGVGMDVVRKNIEQIKGRVEISSTPGHGSRFTLRIPLTLAIIEGLLLRVGESKYTVPLLSVRESFRPKKSMITATPDGDELARVRDDFIPIIRIAELFPFGEGVSELTDGMLVIVEEGEEPVALFVDEMLGQHQTVIKPLPTYLKNLRCVSGCTILSDGEVSLIFNVKSLMEKARKDLTRKNGGHPK